MPFPPAKLGASLVLASLLALGCVGAPASPPLSPPKTPPPSAASAPAPLASPSQRAATSLVHLEPAKGDTPFSSFLLVNKNPDAIRGARHWPGLFGLVERRGPDDVFRSFPPPAGYCLSVAAEGEIAPGKSAVVAELPIMGGERILPPGRYRFVVPHLRASDLDTAFAATLPFEVRGLDPEESEELVRLFDREDVRACPDASAYLLETILRFAAPEVLPRLFDLEAETLDERARIDAVLAFFPEWTPRLGRIAKGRSAASLAAAVTLVETHVRGEPLRAAAARLAAMLADDKGEPPPRALDALSRVRDFWTPDVAPNLVARLDLARRTETRIALAMVIGSAGKDGLGAHARSAVVALRRAARKTPEGPARAGLLDTAAELAEELGDEPARDHPGLGLSQPAELGGSIDDPCRDLFSRLRQHPALRFTPAAWPGAEREALHTTFGTSGVELYRPSEED